MSLSTYLTCDKVMDPFGSTCGMRTLYATTDQTVVRKLARADRWMIDTADRTLCPMHSGIPAPLGSLRIVGGNHA